jgi:hypothetical protein
MRINLLAGVIVAVLALSPAYAATSKNEKKASATKKHATSTKKTTTKKSMEDEAWSSDQSAKKTPVKKTTAKKDDKLKPTVKVTKETTPAAKTKTADAKTKSPDAKDDNPADIKDAQDIEKLAKSQATKNPKAALSTYEKLIQGNPNYAYAGDVYANMYNLSVKTHADTLTQLKYAGFAGQKLEAGLSRSPVSMQQVQHFKLLEDQLTNKWIEDETQKIMAGKE